MKVEKIIFYLAFLTLYPVIVQTGEKIKVVAVNPTYESIAKEVGGDLVETYHMCEWNQDPHFVRGKPSYALMLRDADLFITTGLDLELWAPSIVDKSGNPYIRDGEKGYVSASSGIKLLEVPLTPSRELGDLHIYGNPHIYTNPLNIIIMAENIVSGLKKVSPENSETFSKRLADFKSMIYKRLFGEELVRIIGGKRLASLARAGKIYTFLEKNEYEGKRLIDLTGGWLKTMEPLRGKEIVCYHNDFIYFTDLFDMKIAGYLEPKPGIPPSTRHLFYIVNMMKERGIKVIVAANYFDKKKVKTAAEKVSGIPVIIPMFVGGQGIDNFPELMDLWVEELTSAFKRIGS